MGIRGGWIDGKVLCLVVGLVVVMVHLLIHGVYVNSWCICQFTVYKSIHGVHDEMTLGKL